MMKKGPGYTLLYEDSLILAIDKGPGISTIADRQLHGTENVKSKLEKLYGKLFTIHRLDHDTSGVLVFARTAEAHRSLSLQFQERTVQKNYFALVEGRVLQDEGRMDNPLKEMANGRIQIHPKGKASVTEWVVLERFRNFSFLNLNPLTGRRHQIRIQLANIGHPIVADAHYGVRKALSIYDIKPGLRSVYAEPEQRPMLARMALHAGSLELEHPEKGNILLEAGLPKDITACLKQLRKWQS